MKGWFSDGRMFNGMGDRMMGRWQRSWLQVGRGGCEKHKTIFTNCRFQESNQHRGKKTKRKQERDTGGEIKGQRKGGCGLLNHPLLLSGDHCAS